MSAQPTLMSPRSETPTLTGATFPRLVAVELRRLWWRRLSKVVVLLTLLFTSLSLVGLYQDSAPDSVAAATRMHAEEAARFPQMVEECRTAEQSARAAGDAAADFGCDDMQPQSLESFGVTSAEASSLFRSAARTNVMLYAFLALVLGASFVAAEFGAGSMGTWLTFQPRRLRVGLSKLVAAVGGGVVVAGSGLVLTALGTKVISVLNDSEALPSPSVADAGDPLVHVVLRHVALVALGAFTGAALALLIRNTGAIVAVLVGYTFVVEGIIAQALFQGHLAPWLPVTNISGFLDTGTVYYAETCGANGCDYAGFDLGYTHSWVYLLVLAVVLGSAALSVFRRRDVA